ncbi:PorV/PorQ family protein [candidate division KSB1 bacterium]|nr:PorV/PorQ family protein [candidate division KSB1 bacterium]
MSDILRWSCLLFFLLMLAGFDNLRAQKDEGVGNVSGGTNVGTSAAAFLEIGIGARAQAMGGAFVSLVQDATAMYWNPAGIGKVSGFETTFTHINWLLDTNFDYAGIVVPIGGVGAIGANVIVLGTGEQPVRVVGQEEGTGEFYSAQDLAAGVTFALNFTDRFSFGVNAKYINQRIWNSSANGFAIDIGALYQTQFEGLQMGFSISNFGSDMRLSGRDLRNVLDPDILNDGVEKIPVSYETDSFTLPLLFRFGLSYQRPMLLEGSNLTIAVDLLHPNNDEESINLGAEFLMVDTFTLRVGYRSLFLSDRISSLSLGGGLFLPTSSDMTISIDYAYVDWGILSTVHNFSVGLKL